MSEDPREAEGAETIQARVVDYPEAQQTAYIIDRALSRRHLSMAQKQALNALMASLVVEVMEHPQTRKEMRIGMGMTQRAAKLGATTETVRRWDEEAITGGQAATTNVVADPDKAATPYGVAAPGPTHQRLSTGRIDPLRKVRVTKSSALGPSPVGRRAERKALIAAANKGHKTPHWYGQLVRWCKRPLPEDRAFLLRVREQVDKAIRLLEEDSQG